MISPLLANIYLHYALDLWADRWRRRKATGDMIIVRYADDFIVGFQHEADARRFWDDMRKRFEEFSLSLNPDKTRLIEFGRFAAERRAQRGLGKPETFNFLGRPCRWPYRRLRGGDMGRALRRRCRELQPLRQRCQAHHCGGGADGDGNRPVCERPARRAARSGTQLCSVLVQRHAVRRSTDLHALATRIYPDEYRCRPSRSSRADLSVADDDIAADLPWRATRHPPGAGERHVLVAV